MEKVVSYVIKNRILKKLVLSKSADKDVIRASGRLIDIKGEVYLALESFMADGKAIQKNYSEKEAVRKISELVPEKFKQMNIITTMGDCEVKVSKKGKITVIDKIKKDVTQEITLEKNNKENQEGILYMLAQGSRF